jgi:hypothetical protein
MSTDRAAPTQGTVGTEVSSVIRGSLIVTKG